MFVNLLVLLIVIAITVFFVRLTYRAIKAQRMWVKILGGLGAGLLALIFVAVSFLGVKGFFGVYFAGGGAAPDLTVAGTSEQIARGEYIVSLGCIGCHGANGSEALPLTGGVDMAAAEGFGFAGKIVTANLTPSGDLTDYTDGEIFRAIRKSVDKDGRKLAFMSFLSYSQLSDDDIEAIIAYLRSLPADPGSGAGGDELTFPGMLLFGSGLVPGAAPVEGAVAAIPAGATPEYGKYVATLADCRGCHGSDMTGTPAGGFAPATPNPRPFVGTLTLDEFIHTMRTGIRPSGAAFTAGMPWKSASMMTDDDLTALFTYLTAEP
jgi:mono/diheme cytochrome c family protein